MKAKEEYKVKGVNILEGAIIFKDEEDLDRTIKNLSMYYRSIKKGHFTERPHVYAEFKPAVEEELNLSSDDLYDILDEIGDSVEFPKEEEDGENEKGS